MKKLILSVFASALLYSCSVVVKAPLSRFESPETRGKAMGFDGLLGYQGRTDVQLTTDYSSRAPDMNDPVISDDGNHRLMGAVSMGILENLDIGLSVPDARFGLKFQILGEGQESARAGNFPLSVVAGISQRSENATGADLYKPAYSNTYSLKESQLDAGLVTGYRLQDTLLLYGGLYYLADDLKTSYSNSSTGVIVDRTGVMKVYNFNFGVQKEVKNVFFRVESSISDTSLGRKKDSSISYGIAVGTHI